MWIGCLVKRKDKCQTKRKSSAASTAGNYKSDFWQRSYPRLQLLTIEPILAGTTVQMPLETGTFLTAQKVRKNEGQQIKF
jgi:hypothetical protein